MIGPAGLLGLLPRLWRHFNIGSDILYNHYADFKSFGLDIVSAVCMFLDSPLALYHLHGFCRYISFLGHRPRFG